MDGRDLESLVAECAAMLLSDDVADLDKGIKLLGAVYMVRASREAQQLARIAQEIAVYNGGVVLEKLWEGMLVDASEHDPDYPTGCSLALSMLSASKIVVERCLKLLGPKERSAARSVYRTLSIMAVEEARSLEGGAAVAGPSLITLSFGAPLQTLSNFAKASRTFREAMRNVAGEQSIFECLGYLVSRDFLSKLSVFDSWKVRDLMSRLILHLASEEDCQLWALDKGLLKLIAETLEASPMHEPRVHPTFKPEAPPVQCCTVALLYLLETEPAVEKMRAHNALSGLKPHRKKINAGPIYSLSCWSYFEARMKGKKEPVGMLRHIRKWKLEHVGDGDEVPVVCSWKLCTEGPETGRKKFGKCALCQIARYCSKEHQKLHWPSHKIHCQASRARTSES